MNGAGHHPDAVPNNLNSTSTTDYTPRSRAMDLAGRGWKIFPLRGKTPWIASAHRDGDPLRGVCKGECGREGHGVLDATSDLDTIARWWSQWPTANIGGRVPENYAVIDIDPRSGGDESALALVRQYGGFPRTFTVLSGRGDGGRHYYYRSPGGPLSGVRLGRGIDLKTAAGYCVLPPSIHPDTGRPYTVQDARRPVAMPDWLATLLQPPAEQPRPARRRVDLGHGRNVADQYTDTVSWSDVLGPHGWRRVGGDGDSDGSRWRHPTATSMFSATVRHNLLFNYSPNAGLPITEAGNPHGLTKFRVYAALNHHNDMSSAARSLLSNTKMEAAA